jgi:hypothetical protein
MRPIASDVHDTNNPITSSLLKLSESLIWQDVGFEVFTVLTMKNAVIGEVTSCGAYTRTARHNIPGNGILKMERVYRNTGSRNKI